ncbi:MAG: hypothetical protein LBS31_10550 [Candidatus Adiutrix sp.]|nr:hypothetical protein [Candidatus Adiutrix sp.]
MFGKRPQCLSRFSADDRRGFWDIQAAAAATELLHGAQVLAESVGDAEPHGLSESFLRRAALTMARMAKS